MKKKIATILLMLAVLGICSFFAQAQHAPWLGLNPFRGMVLELSILVIGVPGLVILTRYIRRRWVGKEAVASWWLFAAGAMIWLLACLFDKKQTFDIQIHDTYFVLAHVHVAVLLGIFFLIVSGIYYWFPVVTGRRLNERFGRFQFWLNFIGLSLVLSPFSRQSLVGMPSRYNDYSSWIYPDWYTSSSRLFIMVGLVLIILQTVFIVNLVYLAFRGRKAGE